MRSVSQYCWTEAILDLYRTEIVLDTSRRYIRDMAVRYISMKLDVYMLNHPLSNHP